MSDQTPLYDSTQGKCFLCSSEIQYDAGCRVVYVTLRRNDDPHRRQLDRVFHESCFSAFGMGARPAGDEWTYRIVGEPTEEQY